MKRKIVFIISICVLLLIAWVQVFKEATSKPQQYQQLLADAQYQEEVNILKRAIANYKNALKLYNKDIDVQLKLADLLLKSNAGPGFISQCNEIIRLFPEDERAYLLASNYYLEKSKYTELINLLIKAKSNVPSSEAIQLLLNENAYKFNYLKGQYDYAKAFINDYAVVKVGDKWGFAKSNGDLAIKPVFDYAASFLSYGMAAVKLNGEYVFIDTTGERTLASKDKFDDLYSFSEGSAVVSQNGKYGYVAGNFIPGNLQWDFASNYLGSVAAVKKGDKWALRDGDGELITGLDYDDIVLDENNLCFVNNVAFAKKDHKYVMLDSKGKQIGTTSFDDAKVFASDQYAAVKVGDKWGFVNAKGEMIIEPHYEDAQSFSIGLGGVQENGKWGYIDRTGKMVIEPQFLKAKPFNNQGIAVVNTDNKYRFIQLYAYKN